ncbi:hypothetical protein KIPB_013054, partial [Kipferlia bialata]
LDEAVGDIYIAHGPGYLYDIESPDVMVSARVCNPTADDILRMLQLAATGALETPPYLRRQRQYKIGLYQEKEFSNLYVDSSNGDMHLVTSVRSLKKVFGSCHARKGVSEWERKCVEECQDFEVRVNEFGLARSNGRNAIYFHPSMT